MIAAILLALMPLILRPSPFILSVLFTLFIYVILAEGWNVLGGYTGYPSFGHGAFFGIGSYAAAIVARNFHTLPGSYGIVFIISLIIAGFAASGTAFLIGFPCLRLRGLYFTFTTISVNYIFMLVMLLIPQTGGALGLLLPMVPFEPYLGDIMFYESMLITATITVLWVYRISRSKFGLGLLSIREDEDVSKMFGVPTTKLKMLAYMFGAFFAGIAGAIYSHYNVYIDPVTVFHTTFSVLPVGMTLFGGSGTVIGPIIGAFIQIILSEYLRYTVIQFEGLHLFIFGVILVLVLLFMPNGIVGWLKKKYPDARRVLV